MYLARLPAGSDRLQIYEVEAPESALMREERFYTPRAWSHLAGIAAVDFTPAKAVKRLKEHRVLDNERRQLIQRPVTAGAVSIN